MSEIQKLGEGQKPSRMNGSLGRGRGAAKAGSPGLNNAVGSVSSSREESLNPNHMYGEQPCLEDQEGMKDKFIAVGVCAMDTKVSSRVGWVSRRTCNYRGSWVSRG